MDIYLGLFSHGKLRYEAERHLDVAGEPHLKDMTETAIQILSRNPNGYVLLVEGLFHNLFKRI